MMKQEIDGGSGQDGKKGDFQHFSGSRNQGQDGQKDQTRHDKPQIDHRLDINIYEDKQAGNTSQLFKRIFLPALTSLVTTPQEAPEEKQQGQEQETRRKDPGDKSRPQGAWQITARQPPDKQTIKSGKSDEYK